MDANLFDWLKDDLKELKSELKSEIQMLDAKVEEILKFKWQIIGGSVVVSSILSLAVSIFLNYVNK